MRANECLLGHCGNRTTNPSGFCYLHERANSVGALGAATSGQAADQMLIESYHSNRQPGRPLPKHTPRPEQIQATASVVDHFQNGGDRCQVRAACGMGKTTIHQMVIDEIDQEVQGSKGRSGTYVVFAPSIRLAKQLRDEYETDGILDIVDENGDPIPGTTLSVHDDSEDMSKAKGTGRGKGWRLGERTAEEESIEEFITNDDLSDNPRIIFAVFSPDSIDKIAATQRRLGIQFDAAIFDEAHNYMGNIGESSQGRLKKGEMPRVKRIFHNEDEEGLDTARRFFTTATLKTERNSSKSCFGEKHISSHGPKDRYLQMLKGIDNNEAPLSPLRINQNDQDMFGPVLDSWSYAHAVERGYLINPTFEVQESKISVDNADRDSLTRKTNVTYSGVASAKSPGISLGTYQSISSTLDSLVDPDISDPSTPSPPFRNVLSFADSVDEAKAAATREHWAGVAMAKAGALRPGRPPLSDDEAQDVLRSRKSSDGNIRAAKYTLLAKHANLIASYSEGISREQKEAAENFFDEKVPGDRGDITCDTINGWNPCAKVVSNYDMFSEGLNIPSVDTVLMNRPRMKADESIYQAVGRSSRKWGDNKPKARVIVPTLSAVDSKGRSRPALASQSAQTARSISRVWRDAGDGYLDEDMSSSDYWLRDDAQNQDPALYRNGQLVTEGLTAFAYSQLSSGDTPMSASKAYAIRMAADKIESSAGTQYKKDNPTSKPWASLPQRERYDRMRAYASSAVTGPRAPEHLGSFLRNNPSNEEIDAARAISTDISVRINRHDFWDEEESEAYTNFGHANSEFVPGTPAESRNKTTLRAIKNLFGRG